MRNHDTTEGATMWAAYHHDRLLFIGPLEHLVREKVEKYYGPESDGYHVRRVAIVAAESVESATATDVRHAWLDGVAARQWTNHPPSATGAARFYDPLCPVGLRLRAAQWEEAADAYVRQRQAQIEPDSATIRAKM